MSRGRKRRNQAGDADSDAGAIHPGGLSEGGLLAPKIQLVFEQQEYLGKHVLHVVDGETIAARRRGEEFSQLLEQRHVLTEAFRDIWLEDLEHSLFPFPPGGIPGEADDRADAGFGEDIGFQLDVVHGELFAELLFEQASDLMRRHIGHSVFQFGKGPPQFRRQAAIARQHLPHFLQARHLVDEAEQALLRRGIRGKLELLDNFGGEAPGRQALEEKPEGIADQRTPSRGRVGDEDLDRNQTADPFADFAGASTGRAGF